MSELAGTASPLLRKNMPELDSVRGIAVLLVVWAHTAVGGSLPHWFTPFLAHFSSFGWLGVNLFFVLSGFLITGILLESKKQPDYYRRFYYRRALRILPAYVLTVVLYSLSFERNLGFIALSAFYLYNFATLFGVSGGYTPLWSLAVEEQFYLLWPTVVRRLGRGGIAVIASAIVVLCPASRAFSLHLGHSDLGYYTWFVADALALGALTTLFIRLRHTTASRVALTGLGLLLASAALVAFAALPGPLNRTTDVGGTILYTCASFGSAAIILLFVATSQSKLRALVQAAPLRFYGRISYGLYLCHSMVFVVMDRLWVRHNAVNPLLRIGVGLAACTTVATVSRYTFEEFFLALKNRSVAPAARPERQISAAVLES
jgi:peptidoglycan/LPS O-acetylase OafA/YrhL